MKALGTLLASDTSTRVRKYMLLPYGEAGATNMGRVVLDGPGRLTVPQGTLPVNNQHKSAAVVGTMIATETPAGLVCEHTLFASEEGDAALAEIDSGKRPGISVEIKGALIRGGKLLAGRLAAAGIVEKPAFPSALLVAADTTEEDATAPDTVAEDTTPTAEPDPAAVEVETTEETTITETTETTITEPDTSAEEAGTVNTTAPPTVKLNERMLASLTQASTARKTMTASATEAEPGLSLDNLAAALTGELNGSALLTAAALDVVTQTDMYDPTSRPQYEDELWKGRHRPQIYAPLIDSGALTSLYVEGWRISDKPTFGDWEPPFTGTAPAEQMTDIPTDQVTFEKKSYKASRLARGQRFDRAVIDWPNPAAMAVFLREETQALSDLMDAKVRAFILANAKAVNAAGADKKDPWAKLIFGCANVLEYSTPTYAVIGNDLWRQIKNTPQIDAREYLASELGLEDGALEGFKVQPARITDTAMNGRIIVGAKPALKLYTPPGAPIRVDAVSVQNGAIDQAVYSYYLIEADPDGLTTGGTVEVKDAP